MTSSGPGCPATVPKGALRRIGAVCGEAYRRADVISLSIEDRIYDYAVKLPAATFKRSIAAGSILGGIDSHA